MIDENVLTQAEKIIFMLRSIYSKYGYTPYKMSKFEEYDFYVKNKDFLMSENVITFNDTNGKLLALKPDVTLSIIKNCMNDSSDGIQRVYYNENVYRVSETTHAYREIMQTGLECFGEINVLEKVEVLKLAAMSLKSISDDFVLELSHMGILGGLLEIAGGSDEFNEAIYGCIERKAAHEIPGICEKYGVSRASAKKLVKLVGIHGTADEVVPELEEICEGTEMLEALSELRVIGENLDSEDFPGKIIIDFSSVSSVKYYNGLIFKGFLPGIADAVLSGGQYDKLLNKVGKSGGAIGFAVYLNLICEVDAVKNADKTINVALPKGRLGESIYGMFKKAGYECPEIEDGSRKLIFENSEVGVRFFWVKPSDVAIYVERGAADIGIAGRDILLEYRPDVYELLDLKKGICNMCVAAPAGFSDNKDKTLRVATKFVNIARNYYEEQGRDIDIIKLNGSIEIAPILGLSDVIVDIVETGTTLKENNLSVVTRFLPISARLIANKANFKFKTEQIEALVERLERQVENND